ncbi:MAG TPA: SsrA-binding protein SmpB [Planctomycetota bacterium]|nr:SsrA-binding protein SmpB [Planctomycetota bacterium]
MPKGAHGPGKPPQPERLLCENRKARFRYEVLATFEAGIVLRGTEVKAMRQGKMTLDEAFGRVIEDEAWLVGANIAEYSHGNVQNHEPKRKRKLLLHAREIKRLKGQTQQKGLTLVPLRVYWNPRGLAKITLGVCRGKQAHDKRQTLREKDARREMRER